MTSRWVRFVLIGVGCAWVAACGDNEAPPPRTFVSQLQLGPENRVIREGQDVQLGAAFIDAGVAQNVTSSATWASNDTAVATVDAGLVTAVAPGTAEISATHDGTTVSTSVTVIPGLIFVRVTPGTAAFAAGTGQVLAATGVFSDFHIEDVTAEASWSTTDESIVSVSGGVAFGEGAGNAVVSAEVGGLSDATPVAVSAATLNTLTLGPAMPALDVGNSEALAATGTYSDMSTQDLTDEVTWTSSDDMVASVDGGVVTAVATGTATIQASFGPAGMEVMGSTLVTVSDVTVTSIAVMISAATVPVSLSSQVVAMATYSDMSVQNVTTGVTWSSSDDAVASVDAEGAVDPAGAGVATLTATYDEGGTDVTGTVDVTVTAATLSSIAINPAGPTVAVGGLVGFDATGTYSDASMHDLTDRVVWYSRARDVAELGSVGAHAGEATAKRAGMAEVVAKLGMITGTTMLTVTP